MFLGYQCEKGCEAFLIFQILQFAPGGGGVLPYMGYIGMCGPKGYGFSAVLVINRVKVLGSGPHTPTQFF